MQCQICGKTSSEDICKKCLQSINIDNNLKHISNEFYNRGLKKAQMRDISGALKELEKSIAYDKNNYYARNLAGLCYRELGMYGEASKNWFLSRYHEFPDNKVQEYIDDIGVELSKNKGLVKSIELYNEALEKINSKQTASAFKLLEEAIEKNPKFVPAYNLLILIHLLQSRKDEAIALVDKVLAIDVRNEKALYYYSEATKNKFRPTPHGGMNRLPMAESTVQKIEVLDKKKLGAAIVGAVVATIIVCTVIFLSIGPSDSNYDELNEQYQAALNSSKENADEYSRVLSEKETEINTLKTENGELENKIINFQSVENLTMANILYDDKSYVESAAKLYVVDLSNLSTTQQEIYNDIYADVYTKAISELSKSGIAKYNAGEYADSKSELHNAYLYCDRVDISEKSVAEIIYYLARSCEDLEDTTQAIEYYNILLENYSSYAKDSEERIATLS